MPTSTSPPLSTAFLKTDPAKTLNERNERPGVYIIKKAENGMCIVGQTNNLVKICFNQYSSRSKETSIDRDRINKNFYSAVQQAQQKGLNSNQVFQRYVVFLGLTKIIKRWT